MSNQKPSQKQNALVVKKLREPPKFEQFDRPNLSQGHILIKTIASTINPSDRMKIQGKHGQANLPFIGGYEGYGQVLDAADENGKQLIGKKVAFSTFQGAWAQYVITKPTLTMGVKEDLPLCCKASGFINPLTVLGIVDTFKSWSNRGAKPKGLINTAGASAVGKMLVKYCKKQNIRLLSIVRRNQQVRLLQKLGAEHIINTQKQEWLKEYQKAIQDYGFNVLFDAIGGGQVTEKLISNLPPKGQAYIYGMLDDSPITLKEFISIGVALNIFIFWEWLQGLSEKKRKELQSDYSSLLQKELCTYCLKEIKMKEVPDFWNYAKEESTKGKVCFLTNE